MYLLYNVDATCTKNVTAENDKAENASAEDANPSNAGAENDSYWHIPYINPYPIECIHGESDIQIYCGLIGFTC